MKEELAVVVLWGIALLATMLLVHEPDRFGYLAPVFLAGMIGSVVIVRRARAGGRKQPPA
jgi:hypothetical protein